MAATGAYAVRYRDAAPASLIRSDTRTGGIVSNTAAIFIEGRLPRGTAMQLLAAAEGSGLTYANCSNAQQTTIADALAGRQRHGRNGHGT
jgi:peptidyl-Lys metalloendopeptidase